MGTPLLTSKTSKAQEHLGKILSSLTNLLFPPRCPACGAPQNSAHLCSPCLKLTITERSKLACPRCGESVPQFGTQDGKCKHCRHRRFRATATVRVGPYDGIIGSVLRDFKYKGRDDLQPILGEWLTSAVSSASWLPQVEAVVSVPTHWIHRLSRPLHAAEHLAKHVAREIDLPYVNILRRTRAGKHQVGLPRAERAKNLRGAFAMKRGVELDAARLLLVDDTRTTGATIEECAKILKEAGAAMVYAAVVAKVDMESRTA